MKKFFYLLVVLLLGVKLAYAESPLAFSASKVGVEKAGGEKAYAFSAESLKKPVLFIFWASWCKPCILEVPEALKMFQAYSKDIDILGVSVDKESEKAIAFIKKYQLPYENLHDPEMAIAEKMTVQATPALVLVGMDGSIKYKAIRIDKKLKSQLDQLVK